MNVRKCPKCSSPKTKKYGIRNKRQRFRCNECKHIFHISRDKEKFKNDIWYEYSEGNQSYIKLAKKFHKGLNTIRRIINAKEIKIEKKFT